MSSNAFNASRPLYSAALGQRQSYFALTRALVGLVSARAILRKEGLANSAAEFTKLIEQLKPTLPAEYLEIVTEQERVSL